MSEVLTKIVVDCSTGEQTVVPLTPEEIAERETLAAQAEADFLAVQAENERISELKASARAKLIVGEPLTEEEASLLIA
jgi:hypothetical protein